ncbi:MAG: hypothetical protein JWL82_508 [Parcubacteria group bacterium]|nr:hypothetical protein [Parcubacteria group bacterium]
MSVIPYDYKDLRRSPRWDIDGGLWYVSQTVPKDGSPTPMYRHKPSINDICAPLFGSSIKDTNGKITGVRYPRLEERYRLFREGIELVKVFRDYSDLFTLAKHRRQVTRRGGIPMDILFFNLACEARFSKKEWEMIATRMPDRSPIYSACWRRATLGPEILAAE